MLTLKKHKENVEICKMRMGRKRIPVYWNPIRDPALRLAVTDINSFNSEEFRDEFRLSANQASEILGHLKKNTTPEGGLQTKHFKVKKFIENSLYTQMNLNGSNQELEVDFPAGCMSWGELSLVCGASSSGKTFHAVEKILRNLNGPMKDRRRFVVISNEWSKDKTLNLLKQEKHREHVTGVDISEHAFENSTHSTPEEFFDKEVRGLLDYAEAGTVFLIDDAQDSCCAPILRRRINRMLRTSRHDNVGLIFVLHSIRSGLWSSQASSSCKWFVLFPRSQRGKVRDFLAKNLGCTLAEARNYVADFAQAGRAMSVRLFSPQCLISSKRLQLL
jgi:hypothetical protein